MWIWSTARKKFDWFQSHVRERRLYVCVCVYVEWVYLYASRLRCNRKLYKCLHKDTEEIAHINTEWYERTRKKSCEYSKSRKWTVQAVKCKMAYAKPRHNTHRIVFWSTRMNKKINPAGWRKKRADMRCKSNKEKNYQWARTSITRGYM